MEMRVAQDTNCLTDLFQGDSAPADQLGSCDVPDNDLWVAALALEHDLVPVTRDKHFEKIPQSLRG
jgi:hypothetical protein